MTEKRPLPENTPTELVDFAGVASFPKHIEITHQILNGPVTIGRYILKPNSGAMIGTTQYAVLVQEGAPFELEWLPPGSEEMERKQMEPGDVHIHPPEKLVYKRWQASSRIIFIAIEPTFVAQIVHDVFDNCTSELSPMIGIRDPVIEGMSGAWREELDERGAGGRINAEALAVALIVHLFRTYGKCGEKPRNTAGGVNGGRLSRVVEYIELHYKEDISLCTLASLADLSLNHFGVVFKSEFAMAPHQFVNGRRIHHAKELLLGTEMPISEVALAVGFYGQSHFTLNFRKQTGTTPMRFRLASKQE